LINPILFSNSFGWLGLEKVPFTFKQLIGVLVIIGGIVVFKFGGALEKQGTPKVENMAG
jgi:transporter family-2 protein